MRPVFFTRERVVFESSLMGGVGVVEMGNVLRRSDLNREGMEFRNVKERDIKRRGMDAQHHAKS